MSHIGFRLLLVPGDDGLTSLGHTPAMLHTLPRHRSQERPNLHSGRVRHRARPAARRGPRRGPREGRRVAYLRIGPVGTMWLPAEVLPESTIGLPAGYTASPATWHELALSLHANGAGYVTTRLRQEPDGRRVPLDRRARQRRARLRRTAGRLPRAVRRRRDRRAGHLRRAARGRSHRVPRCRSPARRARRSRRTRRCSPRTAPAAEAVAGSCRYGQAFGEAEDHYEETNSAGWDLEADLLAAVADLTGNADPTRENPSFPGWWTGHLPG